MEIGMSGFYFYSIHYKLKQYGFCPCISCGRIIDNSKYLGFTENRKSGET